MASDTYALTYMSTAKTAPSQIDFVEVLKRNRQSNSLQGITGLLVYANGHWMESLEGDEPAVKAVLQRTKQDPRHCEIEMIEEGKTLAREFYDWSMAFLEFATSEVRALPGYSTFLERPLNFDSTGCPGHRLQLLTYFRVIMTAGDDLISNLAELIEFQHQAPAIAGKIAAARRNV